MAQIVFEGDVTLTEGQRTTITKAWLNDGKDARVWGDDDGWVYVETVDPELDRQLVAEARGHAEDLARHGRGDGHYLDQDGDYRFPEGGKIKLEDL